MKVYEAVAQALVDLQVDPLFGLIGDANLFMVDHFVREHGGRYIRAAHEGNAVLMALGHAQVSGRIGVATVTHGPALTNTVTALVEGVKSAIPMVLLAGDTPASDRAHPQKIDQRALIASTGAGFEPLRTAATVGEDLARAFCRARIEMRPIVFNMPVELQWQDATYVPAKLYIPQAQSTPAAGEDMDKAVGIVASARWPVVLAGRGAMAARAAILRFAQRIEAPLATTLRAKDLFAGEPYNLGFCGTLSSAVAMETITKSDCLIVFGASLNPYTAGQGGLLKNKRVVQINALATEIGRYFPVDAGLVGDAGLAADAMVALLDAAEIPGSGARTEDLRLALAAARAPARMPKPPRQGTVDFLEALQAINAAFPQDRVYATDCGRFILGAWTQVDVPKPQDYVHTMGFTSIGLGLGEAIGAAFAANGRPTLFLTGDGGFMLGGISELSTAVREQLDMVIVVCNDGSYGAEHIQFRARNLDPGISLLEWPDFAPVAQALGAVGITVRSSADLQQACAAIVTRDKKRPLLIDLRLDPDRMLPA